MSSRFSSKTTAGRSFISHVSITEAELEQWVLAQAAAEPAESRLRAELPAPQGNYPTASRATP
jgi:hypothetical protein